MMSTLSPACILPACIVPETENPLPIPLNISPAHIRNGLSIALSGALNWSEKRLLVNYHEYFHMNQGYTAAQKTVQHLHTSRYIEYMNYQPSECGCKVKREKCE